MFRLPPTRTKDIVMQDLGNEILLYDLTVNKAFCLNKTASIIYRNCSNTHSLTDSELQNKEFSNELILLTLDMFHQNDLLEDESFQSTLNSVSRRELIKKIGYGSLVMLPLIFAVIAPTSAMAASPGGAKVCGTLSPGTYTGWHCNFAPGTGSASFCDMLQCSTTSVGNLCSSCSASARLNSAVSPDFYECICT